MKKLIFILFSTLILSSCATLKNEEELYLFIKEAANEERVDAVVFYSGAFEAKYPKSNKLCELWKIQIEFFKKQNRADKYNDLLLKKYDENCENVELNSTFN